MKNTFKTETTVDKNHCVIEVYMNQEWWHTYDFLLQDLYLKKGRNIFTDLKCKNWGIPENIEEIHNAIIKHLLSKNHV